MTRLPVLGGVATWKLWLGAGVVAVLMAAGYLVVTGYFASGLRLRGGHVTDGALGVTLVAPGRYDGTTVTFAKAPDAPGPTSLPFATRVGDALSITPAAAISGASVHLSFTPDTDLPPAAGGPRPTVKNAFIAVYNTVAGAWLPLATTYDTARHELVAPAPHFSWYGRFVVNPVTKVVVNPIRKAAGTVVDGIDSAVTDTVRVVADAATTGVDAFEQFMTGPLLDYPKSLVGEATGTMEDEHRADCGGGRSTNGTAVPGASTTSTSTTWTANVSTDTTALTACAVADPDQDHQWLRLENHRGYPVDLLPPHGALNATWNAYDASMLDEAGPLLVRTLQSAFGDGMAGGARSTELGVPQDATSMTVNVTADFLAFAMDVILAVLSLVPGEAEFEGALVTVIREEVTSGGVAAAPQLTSRLTVLLEKNPKVQLLPDSAEKVHSVMDGFDCVNAASSALRDPSFTKVVDTLRGCLEKVVEDVGGDFAALVNGMLSQVGIVNEIVDFVRYGQHMDTVALIRSAPWPALDWPSIARQAAGCQPPSGESWDTMTASPVFADATGDGLTEAIVLAECPSPTAPSGEIALVYDGRSRTPPLNPSAAIGQGEDFESMDMTHNLDSITVKGAAVSPNAPLCCPDIRITETYTWQGSKFTRTAHSVEPIH